MTEQLLYKDLMKTLWEKGFPGATVMRASEGIDEKDDFRKFILEDIEYNNLPIIIETDVLPILKEMVNDGLIYTIPAQVEVNT